MAFKDQTCGAGVGMVDRERKSGKERDNDAAPPLSALTVCADDAVDDRITDFVFNDHVFDRRPLSSVRSPMKVE